MKFSQRIGLEPRKKLAQIDSIGDDLRNSMWSLLTMFYWQTFNRPKFTMSGRSDYIYGSNLERLLELLWLYHFKKPIDTIDEYWTECQRFLRGTFFEAKWFEVYDFVEFVALNGPEVSKSRFMQACNQHLEIENSAYRFIDGRLAPITSEQEIEEIEKAIKNAEPYPGVQTHLRAALELMSDKTHPDYRNSIKESISAVESLAKHLANNKSGTLSDILKELGNKKKLHPSLKSAFQSLYGYTNDANGIRHALMEESNLSKADARFMYICCSSFTNYAIEALKAR